MNVSQFLYKTFQVSLVKGRVICLEEAGFWLEINVGRECLRTVSHLVYSTVQCENFTAVI